MTIKAPKKLIEVALPLDAINSASANEKQPFTRKHPRSMHIWWARRPFVAARAIIFAQMVNDPGYERQLGRGVNKQKASEERARLFKIIEELSQWENTSNENILNRARAEILKSWQETCQLNRNHPQAAELFNPEKLPGFHDPFAGGGALPLEAQRLGLASNASDLNPVAVTINKSMIEIPTRFSNRVAVGPRDKNEQQDRLDEGWNSNNGLAEDVRRYGTWMSSEAEKRIGHLYPKIKVTKEMAKGRVDLQPYVDQEIAVIACCWARTVKSPNPVFSSIDVPLVSTFVLSNKSGKEAYVQPIVDGASYSFTVKAGQPPDEAGAGTSAGKRKAFSCLISGTPISYEYIRAEAKGGRMGQRLMAIVAEGRRTKIYLPPTVEMEQAALSAKPEWRPNCEMPKKHRNFQPPVYGMNNLGDLFTDRQLVALTTFSDLVSEAIELCRRDAIKAGIVDDEVSLEAGGQGALAYAQAIGVYLAMATSRWTDLCNALCNWNNTNQNVRALFSRQAIPMVWDFVELTPFASMGSWFSSVESIVNAAENLVNTGFGSASQADAQTQKISELKVVSTDPPYYDNINYADLSDFFYVWLRRSLKPIYPNLFATLAVPKMDELVASPTRHGSKEAAEEFFLNGMKLALKNLADLAHPAFPVTIYYAFKQSETEDGVGTSNTGWETFLQAVTDAGFAISGTWPLRTERAARSVGLGANALASSIVLVCRKRNLEAPTVSRREFLRELNAVLPDALDEMTLGGVNSPVDPVDLSQAIIGPGMGVFTQFASVLEADGKAMPVRVALQLINKFLTEDDFDNDTQFCLRWFESQCWAVGRYGEADVLARAKGTNVTALSEAGVVESGKGILRLLKWEEMPIGWSPEKDTRTPVWEALHQVIRALKSEGATAAGVLLARIPNRAESMRSLAYRLFTLCERKSWTDEARIYNELVAAWPSIEQAADEVGFLGSQKQLEI